MTSTNVDGPETGKDADPASGPPPAERWPTFVLVACVVTVVALISGTLLLAPGSEDDEVATGAGSVDAVGADEVVSDASNAEDGDPAGTASDDEVAAADGHHHEESDATLDELPADTRAELDQVMAEWATKYPTAADAAVDGWFKATPSLYGIGAHYVQGGTGFSVAQPFDLMHPNVLLFDGEGPDATFAGVSYIVGEEIEGFAGDDDAWHEHPSVCMAPGGITLTEDDSDYWYSEDECVESGGRVMPIAGDWMVHVWIGPEYDDAPIFAHDHPDLYDGYYPKRES
jgi:hypothetical protein